MKKILSALLLITGLVACDDNKDYLVTIHTEYGDMKVILYNETPLHKKNFVELAKAGKYDSTEWHRVIEDFMIQGGDIYAKSEEQESEADRIPAELDTDFLHTKGALAAARQGDNVNPEKMSSGSQFYIVDGKVFDEKELTTDQYALNQKISEMLEDPKFDTLRDQFVELQRTKQFEEMSRLALACKEIVEKEMNVNLTREMDPERLKAYTTLGGAPHLDGEYTVFGRVVEGMDIIDKIAAVEVNRMNKPVKPTYITMEVERIPKKQIEKNYGYSYPKED